MRVAAFVNAPEPCAAPRPWPLARGAIEAHIRAMANKQDFAPTAPASRWTGIHAYLRPLRRRSGWRRRLSARPVHEPERPNALLSTIPFVALAIGLGLITIVIVTLAWPGQYREQMKPQVRAEQPRPGTAAPGWIDGYRAEADRAPARNAS